MNEWWINLSIREKQIVSAGALGVVIFLVYLIIWLPLSNRVANLREQIVRDQKSLLWMRDADQRIQDVEKNSQNKKSTDSGISLLTIVQKQINKSNFVSSLNQLRQAENDSVELSFNNVDFDRLIQWLTELWQQQGIVITQMSVTASGTAGVVNTEFVLRKT
jgi:general secretion pathway protein M